MYLSRIRRAAVVLQAVGLLALLTWVGGCQGTQQVSGRRLIEHQAMIDFSGLKPVETVESVQTSIAAPRRWELLPNKSNPLYTHQQWRSPSADTGVGIVCAHLPLPLSAKAVVWLAKQEYAKQGRSGRILGEWVDPLGRSWFEAENTKYHVRGYVVVHGFTAWIVYFGYRTQYPPDLAEISLAARSADTAVPMVDAPPAHPPTTQPIAWAN